MGVQTWSDSQFSEMSWHDNHVHALRIVEDVHGAGQLVLDLDYILEWMKCEGDGCGIRATVAKRPSASSVTGLIGAPTLLAAFIA